MTRDAATIRQIAAAEPDRSTWLSANAGSGKTKVLTDRVARLLLRGVDPQHILCLTYTKAAASEMQNRLFDRLGGWAMREDEKLAQDLAELGHEGALDDAGLRRARRLFARAIETPGGLKIQTIHSFCAALLRQFPLESGVSPQFTEMDDRSAALLREEVIEEIARGPDAPVLHAVARHVTTETLADLAREIAGRQAMFDTRWTDAGLKRALGLAPDATREALTAQVFVGGEAALIDRILPVLRAGTTTDNDTATILDDLPALDYGALPTLEALFLYGKTAKAPFGAKIDRLPTKKTQEALGDTLGPLQDWMGRIEAARETRLALEAYEATRALHDFAHAFLPRYAAAKDRRGWLDFDDLILRAGALLTRSDVAAWVLYRLDGGIDHILVDEAQDTSPDQWQVIDRLAQELSSGMGARPDTPRTIFVVGDKKQSIYSFQGADPREFDRMRDDFADRLARAPEPLQVTMLEHSFRSSQVILDLVDRVWTGANPGETETDTRHLAFKTNLPGRVDLWPVPEAVEKPEKPAWYDPIDIRSPNAPEVMLAERIARQIRHMIDTNTAIPTGDGTGMRPVRAGDILILVQRRKDLFHEIIRACKAEGLPVAGADRLRIGDELAVRDIAALLSFLATPEDSLALATALRSPLFGWDEAALHDLAQTRQETHLWAALRRRATEFPDTMAMLDDLRAQVDYLRPYDLIDRILTRHDGRKRLLGRLGTEAEDAIDALLAQALAYEQRAVDSLTGFLVWLDSDDPEVKRQMDTAGNRIRVMTVHGAKGLESPVVILPETVERKVEPRGTIVPLGDVPAWRMRVDDLPARMQGPIATALDAEREERDRLLYVAMTRAETWLIVACHKPPGDKGQSWYEKIASGVATLDPKPYRVDGEDGLRLQSGDWAGTETVIGPGPEPDTPGLDPCFTEIAPMPAPALPTLSPSTDLGGAKALAGEDGADEEAAKLRGAQVHLLLEHLPNHATGDRSAVALRLLPTVDTATRAALLAEAAQVIDAPDAAPLFAPDTLAEVPVTATIPELGHRRIHGTIDRLLIGPDRILIVDFKTNRVVPDTPDACPDGILRQMGAYAAAIAQIWPDRRIDTAILWTHDATLMPLPHDLVTRALGRATVA